MVEKTNISLPCGSFQAGGAFNSTESPRLNSGATTPRFHLFVGPVVELTLFLPVYSQSPRITDSPGGRCV